MFFETVDNRFVGFFLVRSAAFFGFQANVLYALKAKTRTYALTNGVKLWQAS
jgi:hypothetical protein